MFALKKTILLLWSLTLLAMPLTIFAEEVKEAVEKVDINTADAKTLADKLYGIGPVKAEAIIKFREENGPFKAVIELIQVRGIGEGTLEKNKDKLTVSVPQEQETSTENQPTESTTLKVEKQVTREVETESISKEEKSSKQTQNAPDKETSTEGSTDNKAEPATDNDDEKTETTSSPSAK